jgi:hypothetical protein
LPKLDIEAVVWIANSSIGFAYFSHIVPSSAEQRPSSAALGWGNSEHY